MSNQSREAARKLQTDIAETLGVAAVRERRLRDAVQDIQIEITRWKRKHSKAPAKARKGFMLQLARWASEVYGVEYKTLISRLRSNGTSGSRSK